MIGKGNDAETLPPATVVNPPCILIISSTASTRSASLSPMTMTLCEPWATLDAIARFYVKTCNKGNHYAFTALVPFYDSHLVKLNGSTDNSIFHWQRRRYTV